VQRPAYDGFVDIDVTVPDFEVETAIRIGANPRFVMNGRPLTAKVGQGHQVSRVAFQTFGEIRLFHEVLLPTKMESYEVYTMLLLLARA
jgi:hypothetical protein